MNQFTERDYTFVAQDQRFDRQTPNDKSTTQLSESMSDQRVPLHKREPSLEQILETRELASIDMMDTPDVKDEKINNKVQQMMAEMNDLRQAFKRKSGGSRQHLEQIPTATFKEEKAPGADEFYRDIPDSRHIEVFDPMQSKDSMGDETKNSFM